jgi:hypothetical protein
MNSQTRRDAIAVGDCVRAATLQALKGVEFSRVFICGVNDIYDPGAEDDATRFKLAYVGMTRAMDELVITVSGTGPVGRAIQEAHGPSARGHPMAAAPTVEPVKTRQARTQTIGPSSIANRVPKAPTNEAPVSRASGFTDFERDVALGSPIPDEYSKAHPFLFKAEELERAGAKQQEIEDVLQKARNADADAYKYYMSRKAVQREVRRNYPRHSR